jgi:50S ribosomal protein L16 3-hydroxylase
MRFTQTLQKSGAKLDLKTQMLCHGNTIFINGDAYQVGQGSYRVLRELANERTIAPSIKPTREAADLLYQWYLDGYLTPGTK